MSTGAARSPTLRPASFGRGIAVVAGLVLAAIVALSLVRQRVGWVAPASAPAEVFSGARALSTLRALVGDGAPHPTGTAADDAVRARLVDAFRALGLRTDVRTSTTCGAYGPCAVVHDVLAHLPGIGPDGSRGTILVTAHHDSVPAAPGAGDDGAGMAAAVEVARALVAGPRPRNDVAFLITDGEELGLLGALAFVRDDPRAAEVSVVVNLEARGVRGPATVFETSPGDAWLVEAVARASRPMGSSLFGFVYRMLPNDTDLSVFLARGIPGVNVAFAGGAALYHTSRDDLAHLHPGSVQHQGETAVALVRALGEVDLRTPRVEGPTGDAVWFDVLGFFVVRWPRSWTLPIAASALALAVASAIVACVRRSTRPAAIVWGAAAWLSVVLLATALGGASWAIARAAGALPVPWIAHPSAMLLALHGAPIAAIALIVASPVGLRASADGACHGGALALSAIAVAAAAIEPRVSYPFVAPAAVAGLAAAPPALLGPRARDVAVSVTALLGPRARDVAVSVTAACSLATWMLVLGMLYPALGFVVAPVLSFATALAIAPAWPIALAIPERLRRRVAVVGCATVLAAAVFASGLPPFGPEAPRRVAVVTYVEKESSHARVAVVPGWFGRPWGEAPEPMIAALPSPARFAPPFPWAASPAHVAEVALSTELAALPFPEAIELSRAVEGTTARARLRLRTNRKARSLRLVAMPGAPLVDVVIPSASGRATPVRRTLAPSASMWVVDGVSEEGIVVEAVLEAGAAPTAGSGVVFLADVSDDVLGPARAIVAARPSDAVPSQEGDQTVLAVRLRL